MLFQIQKREIMWLKEVYVEVNELQDNSYLLPFTYHVKEHTYVNSFEIKNAQFFSSKPVPNMGISCIANFTFPGIFAWPKALTIVISIMVNYIKSYYMY